MRDLEDVTCEEAEAMSDVINTTARLLPTWQVRVVYLEEFHRERRIPVRRGRYRHEVKQSYIRFCFPDTDTADAFRNRFGGECLTYAPEKPKPRTSAMS